MRSAALRAVLTTLVAGLMSPAHAGSAPDLAVTFTACSQSGRFCATADSRHAETTVFWIDARGNRNAMWSVDGWHRLVDVADDGEHVVVGSDTLGLVPVNYDPDDVILRVFTRGRLLHAIPLRAILREPSDLLRAGSFYDWGRYRGFDESGRYVLERVDGSRLSLDIATGRLSEES